MITRYWQQSTALLLALALLCPAVLHAAEPAPPNIVFIFADDLGYGDISSFGSETIHTPNIDTLASEGIKFTDFYAASSVCSPSRAALLTGRYPARMGIKHVFYADSHDGMPESEITIAEQLKAAGYATGMVGKWHLGHLDRYMPWNQGFDEFFGVPYSNDMKNFFFYENQKIIDEPIDQRYLTQRYTTKALDFIDRNRNQPFFLYLAHSMPHVPIYASPEFEGKSAGGLYGDVVEELDWSTGQVMAKLDELGLADNTLVIFSSDNGPWLMMHEHGGSAGPLRDGKGVTFEGGQRVPTVARWPAAITAGREYTVTASMMDWFPTFSALAGLPLPDDRIIDGQDISQAILGNGDPEHSRFYYLNAMSSQPVAFRDGDWKLKLPRRGYPQFFDRALRIGLYSHDTLLFNLADDPGEQHNLAEQFPDKIATMTQALEQFEQSLQSEQPPALHMRAVSADHKGYGYAIKGLLIVTLPLLLIVFALIYGLYRLAKYGFVRLRAKNK